MWWKWTFHKRLSQCSEEVFKPEWGEEEPGPPPTKKKEVATPEDGQEQDWNQKQQSTSIVFLMMQL